MLTSVFGTHFDYLTLDQPKVKPLYGESQLKYQISIKSIILYKLCYRKPKHYIRLGRLGPLGLFKNVIRTSLSDIAITRVHRGLEPSVSALQISNNIHPKVKLNHIY